MQGIKQMEKSEKREGKKTKQNRYSEKNCIMEVQSKVEKTVQWGRCLHGLLWAQVDLEDPTKWNICSLLLDKPNTVQSQQSKLTPVKKKCELYTYRFSDININNQWACILSGLEIQWQREKSV